MDKDFFIALWEENREIIISTGKNFLLALLLFLIGVCVCWCVKKMITKAFARFEKVDPSISTIFYSVARVFIWLIVLLIILDLFGVNTASVITVLGAAGLAVGLAMQASLSNIAAGIMLLVLRPYRSGDYIDCSSVSGTIKTIGLFSTELQTIDGIFIMVPNTLILGSPVKNYSRNPLRRADIQVGIAYSDSLAEGIKVLQELMAANDRIIKDPAPEVLVSELADNSVQLTLRFWTENQLYWDVYWEVKSQLKGAIEDAGLNIPFPQRVITIVNPPENR